MNLIKDIEKNIRFNKGLATLSIVSSAVIAVSSLAMSIYYINKSSKDIYVLSNHIPLQATRSTVDENRNAEYLSAIENFHQYFFTLPPDEKYIQTQMNKAMYLVDNSGIAQYNTLKEKGYFTNLISTSSNITIVTDSILMNGKQFTFYATQKIERPTLITVRTLVTSGSIQDVPRTDNNAHGVLIVRWKTLENNDISSTPKRIY